MRTMARASRKEMGRRRLVMRGHHTVDDEDGEAGRLVAMN